MSRHVAVITGAAQGIGRALAVNCAAKNIDLVLADRNSDQLDVTVRDITSMHKTITVLPIVTDVADEGSVMNLAQQSVAHFSHIDWVINNAGISGNLGPIWELDTTMIRRVMDVNLYGVIHGIRAFVPHLLQQSRASHIINVASMMGLCSCSKFAPYIMSKHAVVALSEVLYHDLQTVTNNIHVSVVCPAFVNTNLMNTSLNNTSELEASHTLHSSIAEILTHSSSPDRIAKMIIDGIAQQRFYIFTHPEVEKYSQQRLSDIQKRSAPTPNKIERLLNMLVVS